MKLPGFKLSTSTKDLLSNKLGSVFSAMRDKFEPSKIATSISKKESTIPLANKNVFDKYRVNPDTKMNKLNSILDFRLGAAPTSEIISGPASKILTQVYKLLVRIEETRTLRDELRLDKIEEEMVEDDKRNEEIIDAIKHIKPVVTTKRKKTTAPASLPKPPIPAGKPPLAPATTPPAPPTPPTTTRIPPAPPKPTTTEPTTTNIPKPVSPTMAGGLTGAGGALGALIMKNESRGKPDAYNYVSGYNAEGRPIYASVINSAGTRTGGDILEGRKISEMTIAEIQELQKKGKLYAVGKWQMIPGTINDMVRNMPNIDPKTQIFDDKFQNSLFRDFFSKRKRPLIGRYLQEDPKVTEIDAAMQVAMEWSSVGVPRDVKKAEYGYDRKGNPLPFADRRKGESFYNEKARTSPDAVIIELRKLKSGKTSTNIDTSSQNIGQRVYVASNEYHQNIQNMEASSTRTVTIITNPPIVTVPSGPTTPQPSNKINDDPPILQSGMQ
jgi:hypothetical protein